MIQSQPLNRQLAGDEAVCLLLAVSLHAEAPDSDFTVHLSYLVV